MNTTRTGGMTTMGILNIVFGSFGVLGSLLIVLGGGLLAAGSAAMEAEMGADAEGLAELGAMGGGLIVVVGLISLVICSVLVISGIGLLKLVPWGRTLSIVCGIGLIGLNGLSMFGGIDPGTLIGLGYGILLTGLCFSDTWKQAYSGQFSGASFGHEDGAVPGYFASNQPAMGGDRSDSPTFAGMPMVQPAEQASSSSPHMNQPLHQPQKQPQQQQPQPQPQAQSAPQAAPAFNEDASPGFASMPGIPAAPGMPESTFEDPNESNVNKNENDQQRYDIDDSSEFNDDISDCAA